MIDFPINPIWLHKNPSQIRHLLTKGTNELVDVIGYEPTMILVENFRGGVIWIPKNAKPKHPLALLIGFDAFIKLTRYYGSTSLEISYCSALYREKRNKQIIEDSKSLNRNALARKYMTTERHIRRILSRSISH